MASWSRLNDARNSAIATRSAILPVSGISSGPRSGTDRLDTVKFFTSVKWQGKFADVAAQFVTHKSNLQSDLQLHVSITVTNTHELVTSVDEKITAMTGMMQLVFERM